MARTLSQGPTDGGGGASILAVQRSISASCQPLTRIMQTSPRAKMLQPAWAPSQDPQAHPSIAHKPMEITVFIMMATVQAQGQVLTAKCFLVKLRRGWAAAL